MAQLSSVYLALSYESTFAKTSQILMEREHFFRPAREFSQLYFHNTVCNSGLESRSGLRLTYDIRHHMTAPCRIF